MARPEARENRVKVQYTEISSFPMGNMHCDNEIHAFYGFVILNVVIVAGINLGGGGGGGGHRGSFPHFLGKGSGHVRLPQH